MSGNNISISDLPPGISRLTSQFSTGKRWWDGNLVRWVDGVMQPIGGWVKYVSAVDATDPLFGETDGLDINFLTNNLRIKDRVTPAHNYNGVLSGKLTFARASNGSYYASSGSLQTAGNNVMRLDYDPVTHVARGLLVEESRTNLILTSNTIINATNAIITLDTTTSPDNTLTADTLKEDNTTNEHYDGALTFTATNGAFYTYSRYVKRGSGTRNCQLRYGNIAVANFDLTAHSVLSSSGSNFVEARIESIPFAGFYRLILTFTGDGVSRAINTQLMQGSTANYTGDNTSSLILWGAQVELGASASSLIYTTGASATRQADQCSLAISTFPFNSTEFSTYLEAIPGNFNPINDSIQRKYYAISDGTTNNFSMTYRQANNTGIAKASTNSGGANQATLLQSGGSSPLTAFSTVNRIKLNDIAACFNQSSLVYRTTAINPVGLITLYIGATVTGTSAFANGWIKRLVIYSRGLIDSELTGLPYPPLTVAQPIRTMFSWQDNVIQAWMVNGTSDKALMIKMQDVPTISDVAPTDLNWSPGTQTGYGSGPYGSGPYGKDSPSGSVEPSEDALWSFDNFGQNLLSVHSQDGRLLEWNPTTPATKMTAVLEAPADNRIVVVTDERHVIILGGVTNPRRIKWCSQENYHDWTPTSTNSAGGFELNSQGAIVAAVRSPFGVIVWTNSSVHLLQYIGYPYYYSQRVITDEIGIVGQNAFAVTQNGVVWMSFSGFWTYNGAVSQVQCALYNDVFQQGYLQRQASVFLGNNEWSQEVWAFYPNKSVTEADRFVAISYKSDFWWTKGLLTRTAMTNPIFQSKPFMANNLDIYQHELGYTDNGASRDIFAESGYWGLNDDNKVMRVDRVYQDTMISSSVETADPATDPPAYNITFNRRQAPNSAEMSYGPISLNTNKGYTVIRLRTRLLSLKINQILDVPWGLGNLLVRAKMGGNR